MDYFESFLPILFPTLIISCISALLLMYFLFSLHPLGGGWRDEKGAQQTGIYCVIR